MASKNLITKIHITLYPRQSLRTGRIWWRYKSKKEILEVINYLRKVLPAKEITVYDENGKIYKNQKKWKVRMFSVILSNPLKMTHEEEYKRIYKPVDKFFFENGFVIYNMWGYSPNKTPWQMDGRHMSH